MITARDVELRIGARQLLGPSTFRIDSGMRIGLVGRNGAGKTTLTKVLAGEGQSTGGTISRSGSVGYLPQDPRTGDLDVLARDRVLSARSLDVVVRRIRVAEQQMASEDEAVRAKAMDRYARLDEEFTAQGGWAAESEAARITSNLGLPTRVLDQPLRTLSGGQRRRIELARILFSDAETLLLDEPTNHLDADSIVWLRDYLASYHGGFVVISHDAELLARDREHGVPSGCHPRRARRLQPRVGRLPGAARDGRAAPSSGAGEHREEGGRADRAGRQDAREGHQGRGRAEHGATRGADAVRARGRPGRSDRVAKLRFPDPAPCGRTPLRAEGLSKSYGSQEVFTDVDLAIDRGSKVVVLGLNGAGKTTLLRILGGVEPLRHR